MKSDKEYFNHVLEEIGFILKESKNLSKESFEKDQVKKRAFVRSIEVIGEAMKNISLEIKNKYPYVEWKKITGSRDRLIHGYFAIDYDIVWDIIKNKIPELNKQIIDIFDKENYLL